MHRGSFWMQLCWHLHAIMFTLVAACLTASTNSVIASLIRIFACSKRIVTKSKIFSIANLETFARAAFRKTKIYIYVASLIACCSLTIHWNDMYLPTLHFVTVPLTCANYLAQSLRFSKQNVYYVCLVDATVLRGSCLAQKNLCPDSGKTYQRWFFGQNLSECLQ